MIPPLVMDLQPGMIVLDMCAAPGSKAAQLLEMVHRGEEARVRKSLQEHAVEDGREMSPGVSGETSDDADNLEVDSADYGRATGLLIANDSDYKRSHMLIHQLKRLSSPNLIVTNHDATMYPSIKLPSTPENPATNRYLKFDRILADVPCSGDGTCRKNVNLWKDWNPKNALGLYITQVRILVRALQMLKVGGRVVYSTCSMNPVENEAVIASAIERCGGLTKVELLPTDDKLPLLKRKHGLTDWTVMDGQARVWKSFAELQEDIYDNGSDPSKEKLVENMFAPLPGSPGSKIPFQHCIRVYSHLQDTGGFFIAILEKKSEFKAKPESESKKTDVKPPISSIIDEIEAQSSPVAGDSVAPKIEAADELTHPDLNPGDQGVTAAARQNQENPTADATVDPASPSIKRKLEQDPEVDAAVETKKLKIKDELDEPAEPGFENRSVHYPPPPSADTPETRPGDMRSDNYRPPQRNRASQQFEEPFKYIAVDHAEVQSVSTFYKLSPRFPRDRFMVRNAAGEPAKTIYYTSALIRDILTENEGKGIKFIHGGVKMFMKQDVQGDGVCKWRIQSEGMPILEGYVGAERVVRLYKKETLRKLLIEMFPKLADDGWKNLGEIGERVNEIGMGCCVLRIEPSDDPDGFTDRIVLPLWRSMHSLNLMLAKEDRTAMLLRIFNDTTPLVNSHNVGQKNRVANGSANIKPANASIAAAAPVNEASTNSEIKPGPYGAIVADKDDPLRMMDVKAEKIEKGEDTGGKEQQLNGMGGVEGQFGGVS